MLDAPTAEGQMGAVSVWALLLDGPPPQHQIQRAAHAAVCLHPGFAPVQWISMGKLDPSVAAGMWDASASPKGPFESCRDPSWVPGRGAEHPGSPTVPGGCWKNGPKPIVRGSQSRNVWFFFCK